MDLEDFEVVHLHLDLLCLLNFNYCYQNWDPQKW